MGSLGGTEIVFLVVLAVVFVSPERIPELSRKAARLVHFLRGIANNAQSQLREELGPGFADLDIRDLNPKTFVQKHLLDDLQEDIDAIKDDIDDIRHGFESDIHEVRTELTSDLDEARQLGDQIRSDLRDAREADPEREAPFDPEAT